jgi:glutathione S-transferase
MSEVILHHYQFSPYSEKIRRMLSYAELDWQSVIHKEMPPRPKLEPLAGGYGRIPVAQIGADVFCDSNLIAEEISQLANKPELSYNQCSTEIKEFIEYVEGKVFFACVLGGGSSELRKKIRKSMTLWDLARFFIDRINMGRKATTDNMIKLGEANKIIIDHLELMESQLKDDFIFGSTPNLADFSCYHSLWFVRDLGEKSFMNKYPKVCAWMDRVKHLGKSEVSEIDGEQALNIARNSEPRAVDGEPKKAGKMVEVGPNDYRQNPTEGHLIFEDEQRWVLERTHPKTGSTRIHFPKLNYRLKEAT